MNICLLVTSLSAVLKTVWCYCWSQMGAKPPLSGGMITCCATELGVNGMVITKVIFLGHCAGPRVEVTACLAAVDVQRVTSALPKTGGEMNTYVSPDIHKLHLPTLTNPNKVDNVEVFEVTADVVCEINAMGRVTAGCAPVSGVGL